MHSFRPIPSLFLIALLWSSVGWSACVSKEEPAPTFKNTTQPYPEPYFFGTYIDNIQALILEKQTPTILHLFYTASSGMSDIGHHIACRKTYDGIIDQWITLDETEDRMFELGQEQCIQDISQENNTQYVSRHILPPVEKSQLHTLHPYQCHDFAGHKLVSVVEMGSYGSQLGIYHKKDQQWRFIEFRPSGEGQLQCWTFQLKDNTGQTRNIVAVLEGWEHHSLYFITLT